MHMQEGPNVDHDLVLLENGIVLDSITTPTRTRLLSHPLPGIHL